MTVLFDLTLKYVRFGAMIIALLVLAASEYIIASELSHISHVMLKSHISQVGVLTVPPLHWLRSPPITVIMIAP